MHRFEVDPHRMGWVGQPAVRKRLRREQVAEFIVDFGVWNTDHEPRYNAAYKSKNTDQNDG